MELKQTPSNIQAEKEILGFLFVNPELFASMKDRLTVDDFYAEEHRAIWEDLLKRDEVVQEQIIYDDLRNRKNVAGGELVPFKYLMELTDGIYVSEGVGDLIEVLNKYRVYRDALQKAVELSEAMDLPWDQFKQELEKKAEEFLGLFDAARFFSGEKIVDPQKKADEYFRQRFVLQENKKGRIAVPGWNLFNSKLGGGFKHGRNYIVAARPGSGKTSLITHLAVAFGNQKQPGLMIQVENPEFDIWDKIVANVCQIDSLLISDHPETINQTDHGRIQDATKECGKYIFVEHRNIMTVDEICRRIYEYKKQFKIQWFMVDYLQRIRGDKRKNELENITYHVQKLDELAEKLDVVCILISMANRDAEGGKIGMRHMKGSGEIEQAADVLMALQTNEEMADQELEIIKLEILKNRHGKRGPIDMQFKKSYSYLTENLHEFSY